MAEILLDTNSPIKHRLFWKGEPYDSDVMPHVHVYDITRDHTIDPPIDPSQLLITLYAEKVETDFGVYQVFLPLSLTDRVREFRLVWNYEIEGNDVTKEIEVYVTMPYADITQAIDDLGFGTDPSDPDYHTYAELQAAERWARKLIEDATNQSFYPYLGQFNLYGDDSDFLPLPERIIALHKLEENDIH